MWDVFQNSDSEAMRVLATYDYWYRTNLEKPELRFPRILSYARALPTIWRTRKSPWQDNYFFVNDESLELTKYLVKRFVAFAEKGGMVPVCLMLYSSSDLVVMKSGLRWDNELLEFLKEEQIRYVDTGTYILQHYSEDDDFKSIRVPDGHLNYRGDQMVAAAVAQGLVRMKLID
jgi:hypothetical protein